MTLDTYAFRLAVAEAIDTEGANRLFEAGVDDGVIESGPLGNSISFEREARSMRAAVLSAIADVESAGFEVLRVDPDDLVSAADIAERTGRSRQSISTLIAGARGPGGWPRPVAGNVRSPLWRWSDIAEWFASFDGGGRPSDDPDARFIAATNDVLAARRTLGRLDARSRAMIVRRLVG